MRLQRINIYYPEYVQQFYSRQPGLETQSYVQQHRALMEDCFLWSNFWSVALGELGYESEEIVANIEPMQKRWAVEQGVEFDEPQWLFQIVLAQIKKFRPEILFVTDYSTFSASFIHQVKSDVPSIKLVLGWCGAPYRDGSVFNEYDLILCCIPELVEHFRSQGHTAYHLNHSFSPTVLEKINSNSKPNVDFGFMGSVVKRELFHNQREKLLLDLVETTNLQLWTDVPRITLRERRAVTTRQIAYDAVSAAKRVGVPQSVLAATPLVQKVANWKERPELSAPMDPRLIRRAQPPIFGVEMFQQLHDTKVALNSHIDISPLSASNIRLFEATGVGSCLLTDNKSNLSTLFEPDREVVAFSSSEECAEKVSYLLEHESERIAIAQAGQRRTLRDHTFKQRAQQLDQMLRTRLL
jgi:hypothetical protein